MLKKLILIVGLAGHQYTAQALVSCSPSSCYAACDSSCTYYTCSQARTHSVSITALPVTTDTEPADACAHSAVTSTSAPFTVPGSGVQHSVPVTVNHSYIACQAQTDYGPACPPPPPPPPPVPGPVPVPEPVPVP